MSMRQVRAFALPILLLVVLSTLPASAAPRGDDGGREITPIAKAVRQIGRLLVRALDTLTLPTP